MSLPLVSIVIPCYNAEKSIERCVISALAQDWPNLEIIISDNASSDSTSAILSRFTDPRLHIHQQIINIGMNENFRFCLEQARGDYITFLNSDDYLLPQSISKRCHAYKQYTSATIVCSDARWEGARSGVLAWPFEGCITGSAAADWSLSQGRNKIHWSSTLIPTVMVRQLGLSENVFFDWVLWLRLMLRGNVVRVSEILTVLTDHSGRETKRRMKLQGDHCAELLAVLDEFAQVETLSEGLSRARLKGRLRLFWRYLWSTLENYACEHSTFYLRAERKSFKRNPRILKERALVLLLLTSPSLSLSIRRFGSLLRRTYRI